MGLAETFALLREHNSLADVLRTLEERGETQPPPLPGNVVSLAQARARKRQESQGASRL